MPHTIEPPATSGGAETPRFYEYGTRGDVTGHSNTSGTPIFRAVYKAFGDHTDTGTSGPNRQRASTKDEESYLGLLNEGYRWRDITTGTFLSRDPAGFVDGPNLYSYVLQNPWSKFDPEGLQAADPRALWSPIVREQIVQNLKDSAAQTGSTAADFIPVVGTIKGADETVGGKDRLTGKELSKGERVLTGVGTVASLLPAGKPAVKGDTKLYRNFFGKAGAEVVETAAKTAPEVVEAVVKTAPDAVSDSAKVVEEVAEKVADDVATAPALKYHYTTAPESSFWNGLWRDSSVTDKLYTDAVEAGQKLGIPTPNKVIPIQDAGHFVLNKPPIVQPSNRYQGGGTDFVNPKPAPPEAILPARPIGE